MHFSFHGVTLGTDPPPPSRKPQPINFFCPPGDENLNKSPPRQTKSPDNSSTLIMFNNDTYANFKTDYKHMLILQWCHAQELFESQIPVTTVLQNQNLLPMKYLPNPLGHEA